MTELEKAIIRTLCYFDIFDYPLSLIEVWKWLYQPDQSYSLSEVQESLAGLADQPSTSLSDKAVLGKVETDGGFYFLSGRQDLVVKRLQRYTLAEEKFKRAIKFIKIFRFIPFITMVGVCNSLAYSNSTPAGDIDLFIIAAPNRLWLTRLLVVGWLKILGARPTEASKQDAIDTNFFLSEADLNLVEYWEDQPNLCRAYWINQLVPVFDAGGVYQKFVATNSWIKEVLPHSYGYEPSAKRKVELNWFVRIKRAGLRLVLDYDFLEQLAQKYQLKIMPLALKQLMNQDERVTVSAKMLKFHKEDRRIGYLKQFYHQLKEYEVS